MSCTPALPHPCSRQSHASTPSTLAQPGSPSGRGEGLHFQPCAPNWLGPVGGGGGKDSTWWKYGTPDRPLNSPCPSGLSSLAPRTLALRERLKSCLTAIHCFHEARLDDECAFYTSRAPPSGPTRVCTNPVATLLEWQDALVRLQPTAQLWLHSEPDGRWGTGTGGHLGSFTERSAGRLGYSARLAGL